MSGVTRFKLPVIEVRKEQYGEEWSMSEASKLNVIARNEAIRCKKNVACLSMLNIFITKHKIASPPRRSNDVEFRGHHRAFDIKRAQCVIGNEVKPA